MALNLGTTALAALYLGSTAISTAYLGSVQVYDAGGAAFDPATLFASGEEGAWYEPSTTTAFRSTTDLTPCDYGQSAGFLLDLSKGAGYSGGSFTGLGSELVTNGTFDTDVSGFLSEASTSISWSGGVLEAISTSAGSSYVYQNITTEVGKSYLLECDFNDGGNILAAFNGVNLSGSVLAANTSANSSKSLIFVAQSTSSSVGARPTSAKTWTMDNISVRELPGNHATQGTEAARPILARVPEGGRRNLLERTEEFDDAAWTAFRLVLTTPAITPPAGLSGTVYKISDNTQNSSHVVVQANSNLVTSETWTVSCYIKDAGEGVFVQLRPWSIGTGVAFATFDPSDGSLTESGGTALVGTPVATSIGDGWYRVEMTCSADIIDSNDGIALVLSNSGTGGEYPSYIGDGSGLYIFGAQLEAASTATAYQKVVNQYDITEAGVTSLEYLAFDGSDDVLATSGQVITGADFGVWAGVASNDLSQGSRYMVQGINSGSGRIMLYSTRSTPNVKMITILAGSTYIDSPTQDTNAHIYTTLRETGGSLETRFDGAVAGSRTGVPVSAENAAVQIGGISGVEYYDGKLFSLIVRGAASTAGEISDTESYVANLSGVSI